MNGGTISRLCPSNLNRSNGTHTATPSCPVTSWTTGSFLAV